MKGIDDLYVETNKFNEPKKFNFEYNPYYIELIEQVLNGVFNESEKKINKNCRIYVDGNLLNPYKSLNLLSEIINKKLVSINWFNLFKGKDFLFFINFAGEFSEDLLNVSKKYFKNEFNDGNYIIEHHVIFGKYNQTSFGIHIDDANDRVIHYNVGENDKKLFLKPFSEYVSINGESDMEYNEDILKGFTLHTINAGEVFVLPADYYHIGQSKEVSFNIVLALTKINNITRIDEYTKKIKKIISNKSEYDKSRKNFEHDDDMEEVLKSPSLISILNDFKYELISNSSFIEKPKVINNINLKTIQKSKFKFVNNIYTQNVDNFYYFYSNGYRCQVELVDYDEVCEVLKFDILDFNNYNIFDNSIKSSFILWLLHTKSILEVS